MPNNFVTAKPCHRRYLPFPFGYFRSSEMEAVVSARNRSASLTLRGSLLRVAARSASFQPTFLPPSLTTRSVDMPSGFGASLAESFDEDVSIAAIPENGFATVAPVHDLVSGARKLETQLSGHETSRAESTVNVNIDILQTDLLM